MKRIFIFKRSSIFLGVLAILGLLGGISFFVLGVERGNQTATALQRPYKEFTIITAEYESKLDNGQTIEVYRWDPGTIVVDEGDQVTLKFYGVNGKFHPFEIKGLGVKGEVKKGRETTVTFTADKEGTYEIICSVHAELPQNGPMVGYLIVD